MSMYKVNKSAEERSYLSSQSKRINRGKLVARATVTWNQLLLKWYLVVLSCSMNGFVPEIDIYTINCLL